MIPLRNCILLLIFPFLSLSQGFGEDVALIPIESDAPVLERLREEGWYGRLLELQGKNQEALEYYLQTETPEGSGNRAELLKWYLGLGDIPQSVLETHRTAMLAEYYSSGKMKLSDLKSEIAGSFEIAAAESGNLFILPFLFARNDAVPEIDTKSAETDTQSEIRSEMTADELSDDEVLIQLGSFREEQNASSHIAHLKEKGIEAELKIKSHNDEKFYITVIEPGDNIQQTLLRLKEKGVEGFPLYP